MAAAYDVTLRETEIGNLAGFVKPPSSALMVGGEGFEPPTSSV